MGVFETDSDGCCTFVNERWLAITGSQHAPQYPWFDIVAPEDRPHTLLAWSQAVRNALPFQAEFRVGGQDTETPIWVLGQCR
ncbi:MAG: PAS domain-containing protein, partial [Rhodospirillaceae bacterium]|nr:PAS domain-containing protein [Rhodospirillaceae bacterium]